MVAYNASIKCLLIRISFLALFCGGVRWNGALHTTREVTLSLEFCLAFLESVVFGFSKQGGAEKYKQAWSAVLLVGVKQGLQGLLFSGYWNS